MHRGQVFLGRRTGGRGWQFPQGGVRAGESLEQALYRELEEEIGVDPRRVELIGQTSAGCAIGCPRATCAATSIRCASARSSAGSCCA